MAAQTCFLSCMMIRVHKRPERGKKPLKTLQVCSVFYLILHVFYKELKTQLAWSDRPCVCCCDLAWHIPEVVLHRLYSIFLKCSKYAVGLVHKVLTQGSPDIWQHIIHQISKSHIFTATSSTCSTRDPCLNPELGLELHGKHKLKGLVSEGVGELAFDW